MYYVSAYCILVSHPLVLYLYTHTPFIYFYIIIIPPAYHTSDNPKGWVGYGEARGSIAAFLYVFKRGLDTLPTKLRKCGGPSLAQQDLPELGPSFGADSLVIPMGRADPRLARSKLGSYYERFPDGTNTLFGGSRGASVELKDLKVYHGVYAEGEYIPFTDAEPFALY